MFVFEKINLITNKIKGEVQKSLKKTGRYLKSLMSRKKINYIIMLKKMIFTTAIFIGLVFSMQQNCFAQEKTKEELKAEREVLKSEMKSTEAQKRKAKFEELNAPKSSGVTSVDELATNSTKMLFFYH